MAEHIRIELLDPKWKDQKEAMEAKTRESNLLHQGADVARILKNLTGYRSDIFGSEETDIGRKIGQEEAYAQEKVIWDGHSATIGITTQRAAVKQAIAVEQQVAAIHQNTGSGAIEDDNPAKRRRMDHN